MQRVRVTRFSLNTVTRASVLHRHTCVPVSAPVLAGPGRALFPRGRYIGAGPGALFWTIRAIDRTPTNSMLSVRNYVNLHAGSRASLGIWASRNTFQINYLSDALGKAVAAEEAATQATGDALRRAVEGLATSGVGRDVVSCVDAMVQDLLHAAPGDAGPAAGAAAAAEGADAHVPFLENLRAGEQGPVLACLRGLHGAVDALKATYGCLAVTRIVTPDVALRAACGAPALDGGAEGDRDSIMMVYRELRSLCAGARSDAAGVEAAAVAIGKVLEKAGARRAQQGARRFIAACLPYFNVTTWPIRPCAAPFACSDGVIDLGSLLHACVARDPAGIRALAVRVAVECERWACLDCGSGDGVQTGRSAASAPSTQTTQHGAAGNGSRKRGRADGPPRAASAPGMSPDVCFMWATQQGAAGSGSRKRGRPAGSACGGRVDAPAFELLVACALSVVRAPGPEPFATCAPGALCLSAQMHTRAGPPFSGFPVPSLQPLSGSQDPADASLLSESGRESASKGPLMILANVATGQYPPSHSGRE